MEKLNKKNKLQFLSIALFLILVMNGTAAAVPAASTIYVDAQGNGNYTTIQDAVNNSIPGDTIVVYPGTYTENVNANVENITIRSFSGNPEDTIVKRLNVLSHNFKISANNVTISGFNITGEGSTGVYISGVSGINITNNKLSGVGCGIQMESSSGCNLTNNTITNSADKGFFLQSSNYCTLANNTISDTASQSIYLQSSGNCNLANNTMSDTTSQSIYLYSSNNCTLVSNTISNTSSVDIINSINCTLANNIILDIFSKGVFLSDSSYCTLTNNTISDTDSGGIQASTFSNHCTIANNILYNISGNGIYVTDSGNCSLTGNKVSNTTTTTYDDGNGIYLQNSGNCNLTSNMVSNSFGKGIYMSYSDGCAVTNNNISDTYESGIQMHMSSGCNLSGNILSCSYRGFEIFNSNNNTLTNNTVSNAKYSITVGDSTGIILRNNTASSGIYGFRLWDIKNCTLTDNIMSENWYNFELDFNIYSFDLNNSTGNVIDTSNLVDGKPIYYLERELNPSIGRDAGVIYCINCGDAEIKDFVLKNNSYGVFLHNTSSNVQNNTISNTMSGVGYSSSHDSRASDNRIENSFAGIVFQNSMNATVTGNTVRNSTSGIMTLESENCTITGNYIQNSTVTYSFMNSNLVNGEENTVIEEDSLSNFNLVQRQRFYGYGIYSGSSRDLRLENNIIDQSSGMGIYIMDCQNGSIVRNSARNIDIFGIYMSDSYGIELLDNTVQNVTGKYMVFKAGNSSLVSSPLVSANPVLVGYGIYSECSYDLRLKGNTVKDCYPVCGIYLYEPVNTTFESNTLQNCKSGLTFLLSKNFSVSDCSVTNCTSGGIMVINPDNDPGTRYTVSGCTVEGSDIGLLATGECAVTGNTLSGNSYGLVLYDVNNSLISNNTMTQNSLAGITFDPDKAEIMSRIGWLVKSMECPKSGNNTIYNNYFNNANNTLIYNETNHTWNTSKTAGESIVGGPYLGGNYWANPSGTGFSENCVDADKDGISDSSYEIANGTYDYLPLTTIPASTTKHKSSINYVPSSGSSGVTGIDSTQKRVAAGTQTTFSFNNPVSGVLGLSFTPQQYSGNVIVRIEVIGDGNPGDESSGKVPEGEVYQQMNIMVGNERFESGSNINGASINFRVSRSWVQENNIDLSTIRINRLHNDEWNALTTEMTYEDKEYYYFRAETPGFSRYAVTGDKLGTGNTQGTEIITSAEEEENGTVTGEEKTGNNKKSTPGFESTFAVLGILVSGFFAQKRILK